MKVINNKSVDNPVNNGSKLIEKKTMKNLDFSKSQGLYNSFSFPKILLTFYYFYFTQVLERKCAFFYNYFINFARCKQPVDKVYNRL